MECDARVGDMTRKVDLTDLQSKLVLRKGMERVELNLDHLGRELIYKGDLQRAGANKFTWLETHALLFDHYFVLAKTITTRDGEAGTKYEKYDVSKVPIPMDLLILESRDDDPVIKSSMKGLASVSVVNQRSGITESRLRSSSNQSPLPGQLTHTNTNSSLASINTNNSAKTTVTTTVLDNSKDDRIMYPFRIKHLGKEIYTLYAPSASNRDDWCDKILEAKTRHAAALFKQNAEPFRLRVMADAAFGNEMNSAGSRSYIIRGTPLD
ncbi:hypothetical protein LTS18_001774, partial [Coniosporium uncinatum]